MANKTLYVQDDDIPVWDAAKDHINATPGVSLSGLITDLLREHLASLPGAGMEKITVETGAAYNAIEGFVGRWLVKPTTLLTDPRSATLIGIAETQGGRIAVYTAQVYHSFPGALAFYDDLDAALADGVADYAIEAARQDSAGRVVWHDV